METTSKQQCLNCQLALHGRQGKKFRGDQCRATFNNRNKKPHEQAILKTNAQIRKNRTILKTLCPTGKATVRKEVPEAMGFSFRHFTSLYGKPSKTYFLCCDYAYHPIVERSQSEGLLVKKIVNVQHQPYMKQFDPWTF